ncbi:MAG: hypothetical protein AAF390_20185 [Pseudomonadota bacterium]
MSGPDRIDAAADGRGPAGIGTDRPGAPIPDVARTFFMGPDGLLAVAVGPIHLELERHARRRWSATAMGAGA